MRGVLCEACNVSESCHASAIRCLAGEQDENWETMVKWQDMLHRMGKLDANDSICKRSGRSRGVGMVYSVEKGNAPRQSCGKRARGKHKRSRKVSRDEVWQLVVKESSEIRHTCNACGFECASSERMQLHLACKQHPMAWEWPYHELAAWYYDPEWYLKSMKCKGTNELELPMHDAGYVVGYDPDENGTVYW